MYSIKKTVVTSDRLNQTFRNSWETKNIGGKLIHIIYLVLARYYVSQVQKSMARRNIHY